MLLPDYYTFTIVPEGGVKEHAELACKLTVPRGSLFDGTFEKFLQNVISLMEQPNPNHAKIIQAVADAWEKSYPMYKLHIDGPGTKPDSVQ